MSTLSRLTLFAALILAATITAKSEPPPPTLLNVGPGAKLHGPMTFKNEKGEVILELDATGSVETVPNDSSADRARTDSLPSTAIPVRNSRPD
jgi:hypothetical protein